MLVSYIIYWHLFILNEDSVFFFYFPSYFISLQVTSQETILAISSRKRFHIGNSELRKSLEELEEQNVGRTSRHDSLNWLRWVAGSFYWGIIYIQHNSLFNVSNLMSFDRYCITIHHYFQDIKQFYHPQNFHHAASSLPAPGIHWSVYVAFSRMSYKLNLTAHSLLCLTSFIELKCFWNQFMLYLLVVQSFLLPGSILSYEYTRTWLPIH